MSVDLQAAEREKTATERVRGLDAEVAKLKAALKRAEDDRNTWAQRVLEAERVRAPDFNENELRDRVKAALESAESWCNERDLSKIQDPIAYAFTTMRAVLFGGVMPDTPRRPLTNTAISASDVHEFDESAEGEP